MQYRRHQADSEADISDHYISPLYLYSIEKPQVEGISILF